MEFPYEQISCGLSSLWDGILENVWPTAFFTDALGLSPAAAERIPALLLCWFAAYLVAAVSALTLHGFQRQKSLSRLGDKALDFFLTVLAIPGIRAIGLLASIAGDRAGAVSAGSGFQWLGAVAAAAFLPAAMILLIAVILLIPLRTAVRYCKAYGGAGVPWLIYDVGFGLFCVSTAGLAMAWGDRRWYLAIPLALALNALGQTGGAARPKGKKQAAGG